MIESITVTNYLGESIEMVLTQPELSGFIVKSIDGLGPSDTSLNFMELATIDGSIFNSGRLNTRNINMSLIFLENPYEGRTDTNTQVRIENNSLYINDVSSSIPSNSIEDVRLLSYKYFPIRKQVTITIKTDRKTAHAVGIVEKNEPKIFQKQETTTVSIKCADPFFHSERYVKKMVYGIDPLFEFVYENEKPDQKLTEFGSINLFKEDSIEYDGDSETGFILEVRARGPATGVVFYDNESGERMALSDDVLVTKTGNGIIAGDVIILNSEVGQKYCRLLRGGITYDILNALIQPINWFKLNKGTNTFGYDASDGLENLIFTVKYDILYDGV